MTTQERINRTGQNYLASLRAAMKTEWKRALEHDGIPDDGCRFVVFSDDNPHVRNHDKLITEYWKAEAQYKAGGYVGLRIVNGRAVV